MATCFVFFKYSALMYLSVQNRLEVAQSSVNIFPLIFLGWLIIHTLSEAHSRVHRPLQ